MTDLAAETERETGPGSRLRSARELRGLTQQQAADQLNLDVTVVRALESDDFAALGAPVFAKGHLKRYGAALGLAEETLLEAYEQAQARPEDPSLVPRARLEMVPARSQPNWPWVYGGAALLLLVASAVAYLSEYGLHLPFGSAPDDGPEPAPVVATPDSSAGPPRPAEPAAADATATTAGMDQAEVAPAPALPLPPGHVSISVAFAADSWAEVYDGAGKAVLYDLGRAGTQRTIAASAPLSVTFGNAAAVTLYVNGRETAVPPASPGNSVARFTVQADGTLRR